MMLQRLLLIFLLIPWTNGFAQDPMPSLSKQIAFCKDATCLPAVLHTVRSEIKKQPKKILQIQHWGFVLLDSLDFSVQADSLCNLILRNKHHKNLPHSFELYVFKGKTLADSSKFKDAIQHYYTALKMVQILRIKKEEGQIHRLIGMAYLKLQEHKKAEKHLRISLAIHEKLQDELGIANACISLGNALKDQGKIKEGIVYYERSLALAQKLNNNRLIAGNYNNLGSCMRRLKRPHEAINYFNKALEMNEKSNNKLWISFNLHNLAMTYSDLKKYNKAIAFFERSNEIKREIGDSLSMVSSYQSLSETYAKLNDFKKAYELLLLHNKIKDTLNLVNQANELAELETKYETEKKEAQIKQLQTESELRLVRNNTLKEDAAKTRNYFLLAGFAAISLAIGFMFLFRSNTLRKKTNTLLHEKNREVHASNYALQTALTELSVKNKEIIDSINYATYIQQASLPQISEHSNNELHFELMFTPKDIVSGDFYFSFQQSEQSIFGIGDCTGHGVPGAMVSLIGMNALDKVVREETHANTASMVTSFNQHVLNSLHRGGSSINDGMDLSLCILQHHTRILQFTGANHNALIIRPKTTGAFDETYEVKLENNDFSVATLHGIRRPIGKSINQQPFETKTIHVQTQDRIVLFSDGYADQTGGEIRKKMKRANMMNLLLASAQFDVQAQMRYMREAFEKWKGEMEQVDDVCVLIVEVL